MDSESSALCLSLSMESLPSSESSSHPIDAIPLRSYCSFINNSEGSASTCVNQSKYDQEVVMNLEKQEQKERSPRGILLFGTWIPYEGEDCGETEKLEGQENSHLIKRRKRDEASYAENIGELLAEKVLTKSDVDQSSRLLLAREGAERLIPILKEHINAEADQHCGTKNGLKIDVYDADDNGSDKPYELVLKQWSTGSYVFAGTWKRNFVKRKNLKENDQVGIFWDQDQRRINFSVKQFRF